MYKCHHRYSKCNDDDVDWHKIHQWPKSAGLKAETEEFITVARDRNLFIWNYQATEPICWLCEQHVEWTEHLVSCPILTLKEYEDQHKIVQFIHSMICQHYSALHAEKLYEHYSEMALESCEITILWDFTNCIESFRKANSLDIGINDYRQTRQNVFSLIQWRHQIKMYLFIDYDKINISLLKLRFEKNVPSLTEIILYWENRSKGEYLITSEIRVACQIFCVIRWKYIC